MKFETALLLVWLLSVAALIVIDMLWKNKSSKTQVETAKRIAISVIEKVSLALLTDAERTYGGGTGELKMSSCIEKLIELLPASVVEVVPKEFLQENLERMLEVAKSKWTKNPRLINQDNK